MRVGLGKALAAGIVGAVAVTLANEIGRQKLSDSPRLDLLGERAVRKLMGAGGIRRLGRREEIKRAALMGDLASNALYYALAAPGRSANPIARGVGLGLLAGIGAVVLGPKLGLGHRPTDDTVGTAALTVAWYTIGGIAAGVAARAMREDDLAEYA